MPERDPLSGKAFWGRIAACRKVRAEKLKTWQDSVSYRRGKPFKSTPPEDTVNVPADWSRTKNKTSQLFYQVPELVLIARDPKWAGATATFASALNFELAERIHAEHMMNECLADLVNAAGVMICMVSFEASFEDVQMPTQAPPLQAGMALPPPEGAAPPMLDPNAAQAEMGGQPPPPQLSASQPPVPQLQGEVVGEGTVPDQSQLAPRTVYQCYRTDRVSPAHFLWPLEFVGSDWQKASFLGREGYLPVADAIRRGWVPEGTEGVQITDSEWLLVNEYSDMKPADSYIKFCELFYHPYTYDPAETDPRRLKRIVLIEDKRGPDDKPAVHEDFKWQKQGPDGRWVGMTDYPIKVGTITHISDMAIPPSDSEIGRPQVRELIKSRTQMITQRMHSIPLRWFDVNQVDPLVATRLRAGKWQDIIPMNGPGTNAIGEVARAQYPQENWAFDKTIKADLDESWSMGAMQQGITQPGDQTATEVREISGANDTRLDLERQWVMRFFIEVAQGVGQLMQMFADDTEYALIVGDDGVKAMAPWNKTAIQGEYLFKYKPDSQLRLDVVQRRNEGLQLYKLLRKDPLLNPTLIVRRVLEDHGLDWTKMMAPPTPPPLMKPKIAATFKGEDLMSPIAVALINKSDTPVTAQDIEAAKQLIQGAGLQPSPSQVPAAATGASVGVPMPQHGGPADVVQPIDRRYEVGGDHGVAGSRDSGMPTPPRQ